MKRSEQAKSVLKVLTAMKDCLDRDDTYTKINGESFNLTRQHGICWHVFAHTPCEIETGYLQPVFSEMGLDKNYPVEMQLTGNDSNLAVNLYWNQRNLFVMDSVPGKLRYKLLCDLIEYFEKVLAEVELV